MIGFLWLLCSIFTTRLGIFYYLRFNIKPLLMKPLSKYLIVFFVSIVFAGYSQQPSGNLRVSANHRFFATKAGKPFFWLGDTGWLVFVKLKREEAIRYLDTRKAQGFNVIQAMLIHEFKLTVNAYGDSAIHHFNVAKPAITPGNGPNNPEQYDYWDHVDFVIDEAAKRGIYMAVVPVWGSDVKRGRVTSAQAKVYTNFLTDRYKNKPNIIWLNGGDIRGSDSTQVWKTIGETLQANDPNHLITFHPFGRTTSSRWFHNEPWLHFDMFQSGHTSYAQDTNPKNAPNYGEDNWRFVQEDFAHTPAKPTLDAEPSYEEIPYGLHDTTLPYWNENDVRRYAYWSVFAGGCGFTYGHNAVMQFYTPGDKNINFGPKTPWEPALLAKGAEQMKYLKKLMLSKPFFERVPDSTLIAGDLGVRYERLLATRGQNYAFVYTYTGRNIPIAMGKIKGTKVKASWYDPRNGQYINIGSYLNKGIKAFDPPAEKKDGNDWVLVLESI